MDRHPNISAEDLGLTQEQYLEILNCPDVYQQVIEQFLQSKVDEENKYDEEEKIDAREFERNEHAKRSDVYYYPHKANDKNDHDHPLRDLNLHQRLNNLRRNIKLGADPIHKEALRRQDKARGLLEERPKREHKRHDEPKHSQVQVQEKKNQQKSKPIHKEKIPGRSLQLKHKRPVRFHGAMQDEVENEQESTGMEGEQALGIVVPQEKSEERKISETIFPDQKPENISKIPEYMTKNPEKPAKVPEHRFDISHPKKASYQRQQRRQRQVQDRSGFQCNLF